MKTSISLFLSDILPHKKRLIHKIVKAKFFKNRTTDDVFTHLKKSGLDGYELLLPSYLNTTAEDIREIKKLSESYKFPVLSVHQSLRFFSATKIKEIERLFEVAQILSSKVIVLHMNSARGQIFDEKYIEELHALEDRYQVTATFENMEKHVESYFHSHRWHGRKFADLVKNTGFHITLDTVHLAHSGGDIIRFFELNKEVISNIHLSDYKFHFLNSSLRPLRYKHMPLGKGELPLDAFIDLLRKEKYKGLLTLELHSDMTGVENSAAMINQLIQASVGKKALKSI
jgi:sugar phosphate isomerase/epimerase